MQRDVTLFSPSAGGYFFADKTFEFSARLMPVIPLPIACCRLSQAAKLTRISGLPHRNLN
jgi:hypothetical protein